MTEEFGCFFWIRLKHEHQGVHRTGSMDEKRSEEIHQGQQEGICHYYPAEYGVKVFGKQADQQGECVGYEGVRHEGAEACCSGEYHAEHHKGPCSAQEGEQEGFLLKGSAQDCCQLM